MSAESRGLEPLYAYARALEPSETEIREALARGASSATRARTRLRMTVACATAALLLGAVSAIAGVGPLGGITRQEAVSVAEHVDRLNAAIEDCMVAHGATVAVSGSEHAFTDRGGRAADACAPAFEAETDYLRGDAYRAAEADQRARIGTYVACMNAAGYRIPGWNGLSGDTPSPPPTDAYTAIWAACSDRAGLLRRNADGTGVATPTAP